MYVFNSKTQIKVQLFLLVNKKQNESRTSQQHNNTCVRQKFDLGQLNLSRFNCNFLRTSYFNKIFKVLNFGTISFCFILHSHLVYCSTSIKNPTTKTNLDKKFLLLMECLDKKFIDENKYELKQFPHSVSSFISLRNL